MKEQRVCVLITKTKPKGIYLLFHWKHVEMLMIK